VQIRTDATADTTCATDDESHDVGASDTSGS